jgi:retron-type reverse transcriptase
MVSQITGRYADLYAWDNLYLAYRKAARGKRGRATTAAFEYHLEDNLIQLQDELAGETYRPGPYQHFTIREPKRRLISAAPFRDRVVHHALCNIIEPAFERSFIYHSYANRIGKGTHRALDVCQQQPEQRERRSGVSGGVSVPRLPVGAPGSGSGDQHQGFCAGHGLRSEV